MEKKRAQWGSKIGFHTGGGGLRGGPGQHLEISRQGL